MRVSLGLSDYATMLMYLVALIVIGLVCTGKNKNTKDYMLGGGSMPFLALGISCLMASLSAFSLVLVPGEIFSHGLTYFIFGPVCHLLMIGSCAIFLRFYFKIGAFTPFEYLERRYSPAVRTMIASLILYLRMIYLGMVLFSTSKIFEGAAGWPCWMTILVCSSISILFTTLGGLKTVVWTDVMQFVVLVGGLACILSVLIMKVDGGLIGGVRYAFANGRGLDAFSKPEFYRLNPYIRLSFWLLLLNAVLPAITTMSSDQMTVQRLLASGSCRAAIKTQTVNTFLTLPMLLVLWLLGLLVFAFFHQHPELTVRSGDTALFQFISTQLPSPLPGLVIAGMLAAVISTLNAVFNSMAVVYVKELHQRYFNRKTDETALVRLTRIATITIGIIACGMGLIIAGAAEWLAQSVVEAQTIFNALDVIIIPAFLFAVLSRKASSRLVWVCAGSLWGLKLAVTAWYFLSTMSRKNWQPGMDFGWAGPIPGPWAAPFWLAGLLLLAVYLVLLFRRNREWTVLLVIAVMLMGFGAGISLWSACSNIWCREMPGAVSFQWLVLPGVTGYVLLGAVWLAFGKVQPKEKYAGLTLFDSNETKG